MNPNSLIKPFYTQDASDQVTLHSANGKDQSLTGDAEGRVLTGPVTLALVGRVTSDDTVVNANSREFLSKGAQSHHTTVNSKGQQLVETHAVAVGTVINEGGLQELGFNEAQSLQTIINNGGIELVTNDGIAEDTTVNDGGYLNIKSGRVHNINFGSNSHSAQVRVVHVDDLMGNISNWQTGDRIHVDSGVSVTGDRSHITLNGETNLSLTDLQVGMKVVGVASSLGGTDLVLAPV